MAALVAAAGLGAGMWLGAPAAQARTGRCKVINKTTGAIYTSLQAAHDAASSGATLLVRGTCTGFTEITKNLTITGQHQAGFTTLNGGGQSSVLGINGGVVVTINALTITGGRFGGIFNGGALTLIDSTVTGNAAPGGFGGGISSSMTLTLIDSTVTGNSADFGVGISSFGVRNARLPLIDSTVAGNTAMNYGGGIFSDRGMLMLSDSSITHNNTAGLDGGGIHNVRGTLRLRDGTVSGNSAAARGGGIFNERGTLTLSDSSITNNSAVARGGGIFNHRGTVTGATATNVTGNKPDNCAPPGSVPGCSG